MTFPDYIRGDSDHLLTRLNLGLTKLVHEKYESRYGQQSKYLAAALVSSAMLLPAEDAEAQKYLLEEHTFIQQQLSQLHFDDVLRPALSMLYSFYCFRYGMERPEETLRLCERASELRISLVSVKEACGQEGPAKYLKIVQRFANDMWSRTYQQFESEFARRGSGSGGTCES